MTQSLKVYGFWLQILILPICALALGLGLGDLSLAGVPGVEAGFGVYRTLGSEC